MYPDSLYAEGRGSFLRPVPQPVSAPADSPTITVEINCDWLPVIRGALQQLLLQATWQPGLPGLDITQGRAFDLIDLFQECSDPVPPFICSYDFATAAAPDPWVEAGYGALARPTCHFQTGVGWVSDSSVNTDSVTFDTWQSLNISMPIDADIAIIELALVGFTLGDYTLPDDASDMVSGIYLYLGGTLVASYTVEAYDIPSGDSIFSHDFGSVTCDTIYLHFVVGFNTENVPATGQVIVPGVQISGHSTTPPCSA